MEDIKVGIHNRWDIVVRDVKTGQVKRKETGHNVILNQWWTRYISNDNRTCLSYIHFGSGTNTPVATNVKLTTPIASKGAGNAVVDLDDWKTDGVISIQKSCRLEANEYIGQTISEVGFAYSSSTGSGLTTHSLIADANGNALSIEKKADEVVDIYGTVFFKIGLVFDSGRIGYDGYLSYDNNLPKKLICEVSFNASIGTGNAFCSRKGRIWGDDSAKAALFKSSFTPTIAFDSSAKTVKHSIPDAAVSGSNFAGGMGSIMIQGMNITIPCTGFSQPVVTKEVVGIGDGSTKDFQTKFGFIRDNGTFKVYANDIEVSATADFDRGYPNSNLRDCIQYTDESEKFVGASASNAKIVFDAYPYNSLGIDSVTAGYVTISTSDDGVTWTQAAQRTGSSTTISIPAGHQNKRYWKLEPYSAAFLATAVTSSGFAASKNVHLNTAPAVGDTIAVTYQPDIIAKDDQHTLKNISITFSFNEYTPT